MTGTPTTDVAVIDPVFSDAERYALAAFLAGYRGLTRDAYALDLRQFIAWCEEHNLRLFTVRRADIECFARELEARGPRSGDGRSTALHRRRVLPVRRTEGLLERSPAAHVRRPRLDYESHATGLDRNEVGALLVAAGLASAREHALISLLAINGLRVSEALGADIEALGVERGHRTLTVLRKGGKVVTIPLAPRTARAIDLAIGERVEGPIFLGQNGERLDGMPPGGSCVVSPAGPGSTRRSDRTRFATRSSPLRSMPVSRCETCRKPRPTPIRGPRCATTAPGTSRCPAVRPGDLRDDGVGVAAAGDGHVA
jgi:integrase/recombinase XerD